MAVQYQRGISVSSAVMSFEHQGLAFSLLDTPDRWDFSPRGLRGHLPHPDRGPPKAPRGIEEHTRKLFEVC
jgi:peptide chain release factor 3